MKGTMGNQALPVHRSGGWENAPPSVRSISSRVMQFASGTPALPGTSCTPSLIHPDAAMRGYVSMAGPELTQPPATQWRVNCARMEQRALKDAIPPRLILESFIGYE